LVRPFWYRSNPNLKPEESKQWEAGLEGLTGGLAPVRVSLQDSNLITYYSILSPMNEYDNVNAATIKGVEWTGISIPVFSAIA
jgi:vitamin B12 transporter